MPEMTPGHPVYTFRAENELAALALNDTRLAIERYKAQSNAETRQKLLDSLKKLKAYDNHYLRKENLLFPFLEKYGFSGPSNVMWGIHDDIRKGWKQMIATLGIQPSGFSGNGPGNWKSCSHRRKMPSAKCFIRKSIFCCRMLLERLVRCGLARDL